MLIAWTNDVIPFAMKIFSLNMHSGHLSVGYFNSEGIGVGVRDGLHAEAGAGLSIEDQIDDE